MNHGYRASKQGGDIPISSLVPVPGRQTELSFKKTFCACVYFWHSGTISPLRLLVLNSETKRWCGYWINSPRGGGLDSESGSAVSRLQVFITPLPAVGDIVEKTPPNSINHGSATVDFGSPGSREFPHVCPHLALVTVVVEAPRNTKLYCRQ